MWWLLTPLAMGCPPALPHQVEAAGVSLSWEVRDDHLLARLEAEAPGWVLVGFDDDDDLDGSRLVFASVDAGGRVHAEEHVARPPRHHRRRVLPPEDVAGARYGDRVTVNLRIPLDAGDRELLVLRAEAETTVWLAWSRSADLSHHSARREAVTVVLGTGQRVEPRTVDAR